MVLKRVFVYLGAALLLLVCTGPVFLSLLGSLLPDKAIYSSPPRWRGHSVTLDNYRYTFTGQVPRQFLERGIEGSTMLSKVVTEIPGAMINSLIVSLLVMLINIVLGSPAAYAFSRMSFRGKKTILMAIVTSRLVPAIALAVPFYLLIQSFGLLGTKVSLVLVHTALIIPFTVLILTVFFQRISPEIEEAAVMDGCNRFRILASITFPLSAPSIMTTGLFAFMLSYGEFFFAQVLSGRVQSRTLSVVMAALTRNMWISWGLLNTGVFLAVIPSFVLTIITWKFVVEGVLQETIRRSRL